VKDSSSDTIASFRYWEKTGMNRYNFVNSYHSQWISNKNINRFHLEWRFPDATLSGTAISSIQILVSAMARKAVKLGEDSVISFNPNKMARAWKMANRMGKYEPGYSDEHATNPLEDKEKAFLRAKTIAFIEWLRPELLFYGEEAYHILKYMARVPISELRIEGEKWDSIEKKLARVGNKSNTKEVKRIQETMSRIALRADKPQRWIELFASRVNLPVQEVASYFINHKEIIWDSDRQTFIRS
jgi:hypothetical protein